jgi:hypothetical protein
MDNTVPVNIKITRKQQFVTIGTQQTPFISLDLTVITLSSTIYGIILETKKTPITTVYPVYNTI